MWYIDNESVFDYEIFVQGKVSVRIRDHIDESTADISAIFSYPTFGPAGFESEVFLLVKDIRENCSALIPDTYRLLQRAILLWYKYERAVHKNEMTKEPDNYLYNDKHRQELMNAGKKVVDYYNNTNDQKVDGHKYPDNDIRDPLFEAFVFGQKAFDATLSQPSFRLHIINFN